MRLGKVGSVLPGASGGPALPTPGQRRAASLTADGPGGECGLVLCEPALAVVCGGSTRGPVQNGSPPPLHTEEPLPPRLPSGAGA